MELNLRPTSPEDLEHLAECIELDEHHRGLDAEKWSEPLTETMTFYDEKGTLFHLRLSRAMRVDVQFDPRVPRKRTALALAKAFAFVKGEARKSGFREMIFESKHQPLIDFFKKQFAFQESKDEVKAYL